MEKIDLAKTHKAYFTAKEKPEIVALGAAKYVSICGKGDPSGDDFSQRVQALYPVAYAVKMASKKRGVDFGVAKLEGLWSFDEAKFGAPSMAEAPLKVPRAEWQFRLLIRLPDFVEKADIEAAKQAVLAKKGAPLASEAEFFELPEGRCAQILHVGPFADEPRSLAVLADFMKEKGLRKNGLHHEIYLSDFRKTPPEKLKTILREPI